MVAADRIAVVGGGIIGTAVARRLLQVRPDIDVVLLEKRTGSLRISRGTTAASCTGIYYTPGSLKARLCRRGVGLLREFCGPRPGI